MAILLLSDWKKYPYSIIDYQTQNKSFIRLASVFRSMGIKNNAFILALHNPTLQGIDPHSKNLTLEQMASIALECKENPWYFLREVVRAPALSGGDAVSADANRSIVATWWCFFCHIMFMVIQPRQTGKSFAVDALMSLLTNIMCQNTHINLLTKDDDLRRKNIQRIKDIILDLPPYLRTMNKDDANNGEEITVKALGNTYNTHVPQASKKRALNMGRGLTSPIFHIDEGPFQVNIATSLPAALAAGGAAIDRAKLNDAPYGTLFTTTAGKRDDPDGGYIYNLLINSATWTERFFDAETMEELEQLVCNASHDRSYRVAAVFSHRMLGKTDEWLRSKLREALAHGEDANRDYFNIWTAGNESHPLSVEVLERITNSVQEPKYQEIDTNFSYITRWYVSESELVRRMATCKCILGADTSDASGGDDIGLVFTDVETGEVIGAGTYNETNIITLAEWFCNILVKYPNVTANIERRSTGSTLLDYLLLMLPSKGIDPFRRLFNRVVNDSDEYPEAFAEISKPMNRRSSDVYTRLKKHFGFATSGGGTTSRTDLYGACLRMATNRCASVIYDPVLINQINTLTIRNGRVDHAKGGHDDMVVGWLLTHWMLTHAKNLAFYGIESRQIYSRLVMKETYDRSDQIRDHAQQAIRRRIEQIYDQLVQENDEYVIMKLEQELYMLDRRIILKSDDVYSIDEIIRQTREARRTAKFRRKQ